MRKITEIYKDMVGQKIVGIAVGRKETKFFLENGILLIIDDMEMVENANPAENEGGDFRGCEKGQAS